MRIPKKPKTASETSGYKTVWLLACFDLPVKTKTQRTAAARFRNTLVQYGFIRLQYSVYARFFESDRNADRYRSVIRSALPEEGQVRVLYVTDKQFARMEIFEGEKRPEPEKPPEQLLLF